MMVWKWNTAFGHDDLTFLQLARVLQSGPLLVTSYKWSYTTPINCLTRWWFQIFSIFYLRKIPILTNIFQMG